MAELLGHDFERRNIEAVRPAWLCPGWEGARQDCGLTQDASMVRHSFGNHHVWVSVVAHF